jgi:hypothetical protein
LRLCPVESEAGAHGVLLGEPLPSLIAARQAAVAVRHTLRKQFARSVAMNAGLMIASAMRWVPPIATTSIKHGLAFMLLGESARLAQVDVRASPMGFSRARAIDETSLPSKGEIHGTQ